MSNGKTNHFNTFPKMLIKVYFTSIILVSALMMVPITSADSDADTNSQQDGIQWLDYDEGMAEAVEDDQKVMLYFHADWCTWCDKLESDSFSDERVIEESQSYVNIIVDGDEESGLLKEYDIISFPTVVFLDVNGKETHRVNGYVPSDDLYNAMRDSKSTSQGSTCPIIGFNDFGLSVLFFGTIGVAALLYFDKQKRLPTRENENEKTTEWRKSNERDRK